MKVGIISPISLLERYCITNIQYYLPELLVRDKKYRDFYISRKKKGNTIILDCKKLHWKRSPEDITLIKKALEILLPTILILPSYMFDIQRTIKASYNFLQEVGKEVGVKYLGCIEGTNANEAKLCQQEFASIPITDLAIPSHMYNLVKKVESQEIVYIENHLSIEELGVLDGTLVTSLPIRLGFQGRLLSDYLPSPPSLTFYEEKDDYPMITKKNIEETIGYYQT